MEVNEYVSEGDLGVLNHLQSYFTAQCCFQGDINFFDLCNQHLHDKQVAWSVIYRQKVSLDPLLLRSRRLTSSQSVVQGLDGVDHARWRRLKSDELLINGMPSPLSIWIQS